MNEDRPHIFVNKEYMGFQVSVHRGLYGYNWTLTVNSYVVAGGTDYDTIKEAELAAEERAKTINQRKTT